MELYFGKNLVFLRRQANQTQEVFAKKIGVTRSVLSLYEINHNEPKVRTLMGICARLNVSMDDMLNKDFESIEEDLASFLPISL